MDPGDRLVLSGSHYHCDEEGWPSDHCHTDVCRRTAEVHTSHPLEGVLVPDSGHTGVTEEQTDHGPGPSTDPGGDLNRLATEATVCLSSGLQGCGPTE
jgi:hypothetical protein